jgi:hypothetical protein
VADDMQLSLESLRWGHETTFILMMKNLVDAGDDLEERFKYATEIESMMRRDQTFRQFVVDLIDADLGVDVEAHAAIKEGQRRLVLLLMSSEEWPMGTFPNAETWRIAVKIEYCALFGPSARDA